MERSLISIWNSPDKPWPVLWLAVSSLSMFVGDFWLGKSYMWLVQGLDVALALFLPSFSNLWRAIPESDHVKES